MTDKIAKTPQMGCQILQFGSWQYSLKVIPVKIVKINLLHSLAAYFNCAAKIAVRKVISPRNIGCILTVNIVVSKEIPFLRSDMCQKYFNTNLKIGNNKLVLF